MSSSVFQSTPSCRGRHALEIMTKGNEYFNPRPRAEGGKAITMINQELNEFQSTPSCRGRPVQRHNRLILAISIHALVQRAALHNELVEMGLLYFNPRPRAEGGGR